MFFRKSKQEYESRSTAEADSNEFKLYTAGRWLHTMEFLPSPDDIGILLVEVEWEHSFQTSFEGRVKYIAREALYIKFKIGIEADRGVKKCAKLVVKV